MLDTWTSSSSSRPRWLADAPSMAPTHSQAPAASSPSQRSAAILLASLLEREARDPQWGGAGADAYTKPVPSPGVRVCGRRERDREIGWLVQAVGKIKQHGDVLSLAVALFDKVCRHRNVAIKYARMLAFSSLYVAKKIHEDGEELPEDYIADMQLVGEHFPHSRAELNRMEVAICVAVNWEVHLPTVDRFAASQLTAIGCTFLEGPVQRALVDVMLNSSLTRSLPPSLLSLAVVSLVLEVHIPNLWLSLTNTLATAMKVEFSRLIYAREAISRKRPAPGAAINGYGARLSGFASHYAGVNQYSPLTPDDSDFYSSDEEQNDEDMEDTENRRPPSSCCSSRPTSSASCPLASAGVAKKKKASSTRRRAARRAAARRGSKA